MPGSRGHLRNCDIYDQDNNRVYSSDVHIADFDCNCYGQLIVLTGKAADLYMDRNTVLEVETGKKHCKSLHPRINNKGECVWVRRYYWIGKDWFDVIHSSTRGILWRGNWRYERDTVRDLDLNDYGDIAWIRVSNDGRTETRTSVHVLHGC
jgi:hypothetical protein